MDHFLKVFIEFATILLLFCALVSWPRGIWHSCPPTRDRTYTPYIRTWSLKPLGLQRSPLDSFLSESESRSVVSDSLWPQGLYSPWNSPGQNTGVGSLSLLQGIFPTRDRTQVSCIAGILHQLSHKGSPKIWSMAYFALLNKVNSYFHPTMILP